MMTPPVRSVEIQRLLRLKDIFLSEEKGRRTALIAADDWLDEIESRIAGLESERAIPAV
jgi:hypothetical protein